MTRPTILDDHQRALVDRARTATLATTAPDGRPRLVPVCFVLGEVDDDQGRPRLYTPLDEKPKRDPDPKALARVRDLLVLPQATVLVDRWDEDWSRLAWIRMYGTGELLEPEPREVEEHARAVAGLRAKYPQYHEHDLDARPMIRIAVDRVVTWGDPA
ncbi:MAG: TIGR03668 family PPOX class F420-dependent oxidoreductase [Candidatus Limnocylindrales bacterium]